MLVWKKEILDFLTGAEYMLIYFIIGAIYNYFNVFDSVNKGKDTIRSPAQMRESLIMSCIIGLSLTILKTIVEPILMASYHSDFLRYFDSFAKPCRNLHQRRANIGARTQRSPPSNTLKVVKPKNQIEKFINLVQ